MMVRLAKTMQGRRSGDGRVNKLKAQQPNGNENDPGSIEMDEHQNSASTTQSAGRRTGEISQALAWEKNARFLFMKSPSSKTSTTSVSSTSPSTDLFPFFTEGGIVGGGSESDEEREERSSVQSGRSGAGSQQGKDATRKLDCQNPLFHMPLRSDAQKEAELSIASTSIFPHAESPLAGMIGSNPMFSMANRNVDRASAPQPRPIVRQRGEDKKAEKRGKEEAGRTETPEERAARKERKKKNRVAYEHVGRMDVRATVGEAVVADKQRTPKHATSETLKRAGSELSTPRSMDSSSSKSPSETQDGQPVLRRGFRVDSFARNEGDRGEVAHFKFVFTFESADGTSVDHNRQVLDCVHERGTGKLRVRVNDGRVIKAIRSAVEIVLVDIGPVVFNPKLQPKGHHLYSLRLGSNTLFSVVA